jgi:hypothetical protein
LDLAPRVCLLCLLLLKKSLWLFWNSEFTDPNFLDLTASQNLILSAMGWFNFNRDLLNQKQAQAHWTELSSECCKLKTPLCGVISHKTLWMLIGPFGLLVDSVGKELVLLWDYLKWICWWNLYFCYKSLIAFLICDSCLKLPFGAGHTIECPVARQCPVILECDPSVRPGQQGYLTLTVVTFCLTFQIPCHLQHS